MALLLTTSSCNLFGPTVKCEDADLGQPMTCAAVLEAARDPLGPVDGITVLTVGRGHPCDVDSLACAPDVPAGSVSTVYADLADGRRVAVPVYSEDGGSLSAGPVQEMTPAP